MLTLKNIKKHYTVGETVTKALDGVSLSFKDKDFVSILGTSGSGKTTLLNIIGGLDKYDSGDMIINNKSTKDFNDEEWDAYRNNSIGFVFQNYNLISHLGIIENVEMGMTLSGVSRTEKRKKALEVLEKVGLRDHLHKKPNQLSGGQMQRVAIARALANDPDILLCDEPTGALDTETSEQIMDLILGVAKDKLVIMVTHNPELANRYSKRIIEFQDGLVKSDSKPYMGEDNTSSPFTLKKTSMSFKTALNLSFNNIRTKKGRTALTAFASSIGIIGIALILSLSNGFQKQIDSFQNDAMSEFPIIISPTVSTIKEEDFINMAKDIEENQFITTDEVRLYNLADSIKLHKNNFTEEYLKHIENVSKEHAKSVGYVKMVNMNLIREVEKGFQPVSISAGLNMGTSPDMSSMTSMQGMGLYSYPKMLDENAASYLEQNYDVLAGEYPKSETDLILVIDNQNRIDAPILEKMGYDIKDKGAIKFEDIVGQELLLIHNNDFYIKTEFGNFMPSQDYDKMTKSDETIKLTIKGIVRLKEDIPMGLLSLGIVYSDILLDKIVDNNIKSDIIAAQEKSELNVITMEPIGESKKSLITYLGGDYTPMMIMLYPNDFESKDMLLNYLDEFNVEKEEKDQVIYTDLAETISTMTGGVMNGITLVLVAFASISLVVSSIMIGIITYVSVLERTKEIGILKALGARKKDITRVFDAETFLLGLFSSVLGIGVTLILIIPTNEIIYNASELSNVAQLSVYHVITLILINITLTVIAGHLPAKMAAKKDAIEALRTE